MFDYVHAMGIMNVGAIFVAGIKFSLCDEVIRDCCLLFNHDNPMKYDTHLLLVFVFNFVFRL